MMVDTLWLAHKRPAFVLAVFGGRDVRDLAEVKEHLSRVLFYSMKPQCVLVGDCPSGVDYLTLLLLTESKRDHIVFTASDRQFEKLNAQQVPHRRVVRCSDWQRDGKRAGPVRNGRIVAAGPDRFLGLWDGKSPGSSDCFRQMMAAGVSGECVPILNGGDDA